MKSTALRLPGLFLAVAILATCTEQPTMAPDDDVEAVRPTFSSAIACDLVKQMEKDVRDYFQNPERRDAQAEMKVLGDACAAQNQPVAIEYSLKLLARIETAANQFRGPSATVGARLAQSLMACTTAAGCSAAAILTYNLPPLSDLAKAVGETTGLFAVRTGDASAPAVARGKIPFDIGNAALFGTELSSGSWTAANQGSSLVVLYGYHNAPAFLKEAPFGNLGYSANRWPDPGTWTQDGLVNVGVCFNFEAPVPHPVDAPSARGRMQREGATLLAHYNPTFAPECNTTQQLQASIFGSARAVAISVLPRSWAALFISDEKVRTIGGGTIDFSNFAPVGANTAGKLVITKPPKANFAVGEALNIEVQALSGGGTPMELVPVELYVQKNAGTPAGADVMGPNSGLTSEADGTYLFAAESLGKNGGYTLCVRVRNPPGFAGFAFAEACTDLFHVR